VGRLLNPQSAIHNSQSQDTIWALKDVSFEVQPGEVVGIIGRNGAGKSTLLKILSRITDPTEGRARIRGRVNSLLEIGTGFHPEMTGLENIYMNAALHGMKRAEVRRKLDEIIAFAEIDQFLETRVKFYSSGMYTRLAFAVAAHLEPDVLIVDEVLAVGDAAFQKKCLGKMGEVAQGGRTVLFVSHNMATIEHLCTRAMVLRSGHKVVEDTPARAVAAYLETQQALKTSVPEWRERRGTGTLRFTSFRIAGVRAGETRDAVRTGDDVRLIFGYVASSEQKGPVTASFAIRTNLGVPLILHRTNYTGTELTAVPKQGEISCTIRHFPLVEGRYEVVACLEDASEVADLVEPLGYLEVEKGDFFGTGHSGYPQYGLVLVDGEWALNPERNAISDSPDPDGRTPRP
jgi:lipopolysaccharide transport system ATP-binding protein